MNTIPSPARLKILAVILILLFVLSLAWLTYDNYRAGSEPWDLVFSAILLSVPLVLLYFSIGVLVVAGLQKRRLGRISQQIAKFIYRTPRAAGVLMV